MNIAKNMEAIFIAAVLVLCASAYPGADDISSDQAQVSTVSEASAKASVA